VEATETTGSQASKKPYTTDPSTTTSPNPEEENRLVIVAPVDKATIMNGVDGSVNKTELANNDHG
jgi:hypothetical protein